MRNKISLLVFLLCFLPGFIHAYDGKEILQKMEDKTRGKNNHTQYKMTVTTPEWQRSITLLAWDDRQNNRAFVKIVDPPKDRDTLFLRLEYKLWMFIPKLEKVIKIPPSMMLQPWMGSDFTNDDLVKESSIITDYEHRIMGMEKLGEAEAYKIELIPKPDAPVVWGKIIYWVSKDFSPVREQFFDERERLIKELNCSQFKSMGGRNIPTLYEMRTITKPGHVTTLKINAIDFDQEFSESLFSLKNLKRGR